MQSRLGFGLTREAAVARDNPLFPPPTLRERRHRGLARCRISVCRPAIAVIAEGERPEPRRSYRRSDRFHDPADDDAIGKHIKVVVLPHAGGAGSGGAFKDQIVLVHFTEPTCAASLDHLVGAGEQRRGHIETECLRRYQVHHKLEFGRLFDRKFAWLCSAQNLVD